MIPEIRLRCILALTVSMTLLGACTSSNTAETDPPEATVQPVVMAQEQQQVPEVAALQPQLPEPAPEPVPEPESLLEVPPPASLIGYAPHELKDLFGEPSFVRQDPPAALWQYKAASCIMDLYLYDDGAQNYTVTHLEFRQTGQSAEQYEQYEQCLRLIIIKKPS